MYFLVSKLDPKNHAKVAKEPFSTEYQAIDRARTLLASGKAFAGVLEDDNGTIADDAEVLERCALAGPACEGTMEWDVFISHASEDKDDFVRHLAESLRRSGLRVWFDELTLTVGDSPLLD